MPGYVFYVDQWFIKLATNTLFLALLIWATAEITKTKTTRIRVFLASLSGTLYYLLFLLSSLQLIPYYGLLRSFPIIVLVSMLMLFIAFFPISLKKFLTVTGFFYLTGFVSAGSGIAFAYLFGTPMEPNLTVGTIFSIATILILGELGWGIVQKRIFHHVYRIPVEIYWNDRSIRIYGLVDTGNRLRDPLTNQAVMIVEHQALKELFSDTLNDVLEQLETGDLTPISDFSVDGKLASRLRLIPFRSIGKENGILVGFRPDRVQIMNDKVPYGTDNIVVAIHHRSLDREGNYSALIPSELLQEAMVYEPRVEPAVKGGSSHAPSPHPKI
ncbi:MAG: sigma-E processing peptidase SpoIIGA [Firmicutes bacterium]|nr:sigma-E processing peptidase SpoIIGA [Bacillota bacterium]